MQERAGNITLRELEAIEKLLRGPLGNKVRKRGLKELLMRVENSVVVRITNSFVSASRYMMHELGRLKVLSDRLGVLIRSDWLLSAMNRYTDSLSRRLPRGDLRIRRSVRQSILDGMREGKYIFRHWPLGESPAAARKQAWLEMASEWKENEVRLLCPPLNLELATVVKLMRKRLPEVLRLRHWPKQAWYQTAVGMD